MPFVKIFRKKCSSKKTDITKFIPVKRGYISKDAHHLSDNYIICTSKNVIYPKIYIRICIIKYYTVQVTNLYTDASDSQDNHTEVYNIIRMQMTTTLYAEVENFSVAKVL